MHFGSGKSYTGLVVFNLKMRDVLGDLRLRCWRSTVSYSVLAVAGMFAGAEPANGAVYTVSTEAELAMAITQANSDGDVASTINLVGNLTIANPAALPMIQKTLTINIGSYLLTASQDSVLNVDGGAELTIVGQQYGSRQLLKEGGGALNLNSSGQYDNKIVVNGGQLNIQSGANIMSGTASTGGLDVAQANSSVATIVVRDNGTRLETKINSANLAMGLATTGSIRVESGATLIVPALQAITNDSNSKAYITVTGEDSLFQANGGFFFGKGVGHIVVEDGGSFRTTGQVVLGGNAVGVATGGTTFVSVTGKGSQWIAGINYNFLQGSLAVQDGGVYKPNSFSLETTRMGLLMLKCRVLDPK